nr:cytochrome c oxidase subunit II [Parakontikia ventrolineata]
MVELVSVPMLDYHTLVGVDLDRVYDYAMAIAYGISFFVFLMIFFYVLNYYVFNNFVESKVLEFIWTTVPGGILISLLLPSVRGLYSLDYTRFNKVHMNVVVSGRQWYWSYKFLPRASKRNTCLDCLNYFSIAGKQNYFLNTANESSNVLLPFWSEKVRDSYQKQDYLMSRFGSSAMINIPKRLYNNVFKKENLGFSSNKLHRNLNKNDFFSLHPSQNNINISSEEINNLYTSNFLQNISNLSRKVDISYEVDSYASVQNNIGTFRNLDVDLPLLVPVHKLIRFFFWSSDVIHSFAIPDLSIKLDCVPGRLNSAFTVIRHVGKFYGQCSELCGANHSFMPSSLEAYILNNTICFNKHYQSLYSARWESNFFVRTTLVRLWGLLGWIFVGLLNSLGLSHWPTYSESLPVNEICPFCNWVRNSLINIWGSFVGSKN